MNLIQQKDWLVRLESNLAEAANTPSFWTEGELPFALEMPPDGVTLGIRSPTPVMTPFLRSQLLRVFRAVTQNELRLGYQPCIDSRTGQVSHLEALLRWPVKPDSMNIQQLVNVLEGNGLIVPVGAWVIRQACRDLAVLRADGHRNISISVNVSNSQIDDPGLAHLIADSLKVNSIPGRRLMIELTETMLPNLVAAKKLVASMRRIGVQTMIDDFGMGFSNFTLLKDVPAAAIKIDRSYTAQVNRSRRTAALTESLVDMAERLGIEVIAEGVETAGQKRWLTAHGVHKLQGFFYSQAVNLESIRCLLEVQPWTINSVVSGD